MKKGIFDKIVTILLVLLCVGLAVAVYQKVGSDKSGDKAAMARGMRGAESDAESASNVTVAAVNADGYIETRKLSGEISSPDKDIIAYPQIGGTVSSILVERGDQVKKGDVLLYIDPSKPGMTYKESAVLSPADGVVYSVNVAVGDTVSTSTALVELRGERKLKIDVNVSEKNVGTLRMGAHADITSIAYPGQSWNAEVTYISDVIDSTSRTLPVELTITDDTTGLLEGMYVNAALVVKELPEAITVPVKALSTYAGDKVVFVVNGDRAGMRVVTVGDSNGTDTVIISGLEKGERVITAGNVTDGTLISIVE